MGPCSSERRRDTNMLNTNVTLLLNKMSAYTNAAAKGGDPGAARESLASEAWGAAS